MKRKFYARFPIAATLAVVAGLFLWVAWAGAARHTAAEVQWDDKASQELAEALHHVHEVWNSGDIQGLKRLVVGDERLASYELDPKDHTPIRLSSKAAIDTFVDRVVNQIDTDNVVTQLEKPVVNCRATATFGVCTEECTIHVKSSNGSERIDRLWSTNVAVKYADGWKWIQWQMSEAGPGAATANAGHH